MRRCTLFYIFLILFFASCRSVAPAVQESTREVVREVVRTDTIITIAPDTATLAALLRCDSAGNVLIAQLTEAQGKRLALELQLHATAGGQTALRIDCKADSLQRLLNALRTETTIRDNTHTTQTLVQKVVPTFYRNCTRGFWLLLSAIVLYLAARIVIKFYLRR